MSIIPHGWELETTLRIKPKKVLMSYFYLSKMKPHKLEELFSTLRGLGIMTLIDSGVFSLKIKYGKGMFAISSPHERLTQHEKDVIIQTYTEKIGIFEKFKNDYIEFLKVWGDKLDFAVDMDVDQFLGLSVAEKWYRDIITVFPTSRLLRVWHAAERDFGDWKKWCESGLYTYLAIEGGGSHGLKPDFYHPFIDTAHQYGIKVHILGMTSIDFLNKVNCDTGDSTTYQCGARFGQIHTPWGFVYLSEVGKEKSGKQNYFILSEEEQKRIREFITDHGFSFESFLESNHTKKSRAGIERSAWNMFYQEKYFGVIVAKDDGKQLSMFD